MISGLNIYARVGKLEFNRIPGIRIISQRHVPLTRFAVTVPDPTGEVARAISDNDAVSVVWGYRGRSHAGWTGTVKTDSVMQSKDQLVIHAVGPERPLVETRINQVFYGEAPEAIIKYAVTRAGLTCGKIESPGVVFPHFIASNIPVWQVARQCEHTCRRSFGLDMAMWAMWMGKDGTVNWGPGDEPADIPVIESNANLIRHSPGKTQADLSRVETFLVAGMMHSQVFRINDLKWGVAGDFRALKVEHVLKEASARTYISYGDEYERY